MVQSLTSVATEVDAATAQVASNADHRAQTATTTIIILIVLGILATTVVGQAGLQGVGADAFACFADEVGEGGQGDELARGEVVTEYVETVTATLGVTRERASARSVWLPFWLSRFRNCLRSVSR